MVSYYGDLEVVWGPGEWERLQEVKQDRFDKLSNREPVRKTAATALSPTLHKAVVEYAKKRGLTVSELLRNVVAAIVE